MLFVSRKRYKRDMGEEVGGLGSNYLYRRTLEEVKKIWRNLAFATGLTPQTLFYTCCQTTTEILLNLQKELTLVSHNLALASSYTKTFSITLLSLLFEYSN